MRTFLELPASERPLVLEEVVEDIAVLLSELLNSALESGTAGPFNRSEEHQHNSVKLSIQVTAGIQKFGTHAAYLEVRVLVEDSASSLVGPSLLADLTLRLSEEGWRKCRQLGDALVLQRPLHS